jgi:hypothetical protein
VTQSPNPFAYPSKPHVRKHGPAGYADYNSYRPWLRDEFTFRCVFCLHREKWGLVKASWDLDHFVPQSQDASLILQYDNLLYVCISCNRTKGSRSLPDPCQLALSKCLLVRSNGTVLPLNDDGRLIVETLRLNNPEYRHFRSLIFGIIRSLVKGTTKRDRETLLMLMSYPDNLPDLVKLKPPSNSRPEGVNNSYHARRARGELPKTY